MAADAMILREVVLELRRVREELHDLAESNENLQRRLLAAEDRRTGAALVPLLSELFEGTAFTAAEVAAAALNDRTAQGQALRELIAASCTDTGGLRALGRLLARLEGCSFGGCSLRHAGAARNAQRWTVRVSAR